MKSLRNMILSIAISALLVISSTASLIIKPLPFAQAQAPAPSPTIPGNPSGISASPSNITQVSANEINNGTVGPSPPTNIAPATEEPFTPEQEKNIQATINETLEYPQNLAHAAVPDAQQVNPDPNTATVPQAQSAVNSTSLESIAANMSGKGNVSSTAAMPQAEPLQQTQGIPIKLFRSTIVGPSLTVKHAIAEPSVAQNRLSIYYTGNVFAARSNNLGTSWASINPFVDFPQMCCDQDVVYDQNHGVYLWFRQGRAQTNGENTVILSVSKDTITWTSYRLSPPRVNSAWSGQWFDYPHLALSNNYLYISTNTFKNPPPNSFFTQTVMFRFNLNDLSHALPVHYQYYWTTRQFTFTPVQGAKDIMYWATHDPTALGVREVIYRWPDNGPITATTVGVPAWSFGARNMVCFAPDPAHTNWCGRSDSRIIGGWISIDMRTGREMIGFLWNAKQGGAFRYPYIDVATFFVTPNIVYRANANIFNQNFAWMYGFISPNAKGELGLVAYYGGGVYYPSIAAGIVDSSYTPPPYNVISVRAGTHANSLWGDYDRVRAINGFGSISVWNGAAITMQGCSDFSCVEPRYFIFGK
jgi:hypothetical protein